jgi:hypothetical protein
MSGPYVADEFVEQNHEHRNAYYPGDDAKKKPVRECQIWHHVVAVHANPLLAGEAGIEPATSSLRAKRTTTVLLSIMAAVPFPPVLRP